LRISSLIPLISNFAPIFIGWAKAVVDFQNLAGNSI